MTTIKYSAFALTLLAGFAGASAHAQLLDSSGMLNTSAGVNVTSTSTSITTDATASSSLDTGLEDTATSSLESEGSLSTGFSIERGGIDAGTTYSITDAEDVQSAAGFESYAGASVLDDDRLDSVALEGGVLTVTYDYDVKLFGFIPASMKVTAVSTSDGTVSVSYPWYSFLMAKTESRADLEARLTREQGSIRDEIEESAVVGGTSATLEARQWAIMLERLRLSLYAGASAEARR